MKLCGHDGAMPHIICINIDEKRICVIYVWCNFGRKIQFSELNWDGVVIFKIHQSKWNHKYIDVISYIFDTKDILNVS